MLDGAGVGGFGTAGDEGGASLPEAGATGLSTTAGAPGGFLEFSEANRVLLGWGNFPLGMLFSSANSSM